MTPRRLLTLLIAALVFGVQPFDTFAQSPTFTLSIFRDQDSLTIYIPDAGGRVSIAGLTLQAMGSSYPIEGYPRVHGAYLGRLITPYCLRFERIGNPIALPSDCEPLQPFSYRSRTQPLPNHDIFWFDPVSNRYPSIQVTLGNFGALCPASSARCDLTVPRIPAQSITTANSTADEIAFASSRYRENEQFDLYIMDADGMDIRPVTAGWLSYGEPAWSPDGNRLAYTRLIDAGGTVIGTAQTDGSDSALVTLNGRETEPAWSPDGSSLAYRIFSLEGDGSIVVMHLDGTHYQAWVVRQPIGSLGGWSPTGDAIVFTMDEDGDSAFDIYVMHENGRLLQLTDGENADQPSWSPTGSPIAYSRVNGGSADIYAINPDGTHPQRLTTGSVYNSAPTWSPNGSQIAFQTNRDGNWEIYVMNADGSNPHNITNNPAMDFNPTWRP